MIYNKLKRTWSHNDLNYIPRFRETFPELKKVSSEDLCERFIDLKMDFYYEQKTPVKSWMRLSMPFALLTMTLMFILIPINFLFTGEWGYDIRKSTKLFNWLVSLKLLSK